jgi:hypothetical protein
MAQFITIALKATIVVSKKRIFNDKIPSEIAIETVESNYDLSIYDYSETEHFHLWKLKESILTAEISPFIETLLAFYYDKDEANYQGIIGSIKRNKSYDSLFKLAKDAEYEHFELDNKQNGKCPLKTMGKHLQVDYNYIQLFKSERLRLDKIDKTFTFLENCVKKAFVEFELSKGLHIYCFDAK